VEEKLIQLRDEIGNFPEYKDIMITFNMELKDINNEVAKYNMS
jgi:hypothetical protein